ncbi:hypothetical protein MIR68_006114 [Amoeboaphelidium protococcarum]|nr:hypothetical protein MIR68_006114 [Amoeboaphelidium protococcarum]
MLFQTQSFYALLLASCFTVSMTAAQEPGACGNGTSCAEGYCCSAYGFCGQGDLYCGNGCQDLWSGADCYQNVSQLPVDTEGRCGVIDGIEYGCSAGNCCNEWGYCGTGALYCASTTCQTQYSDGYCEVPEE